MSSIYVYGISILVSFCIGQLVGFSARPWPMPCASTRPLQNSIWATTRMVTRASRHREWPRDWEFLRALDLQLCSMRFCFDFKKGAHTFLPTIKCAWWKNRGAIATWTQQVETLANTNLWQQPQTLMVDDNPSVFISPSRIGLHWQALAAALEVNKTVKQVGLSDANLNDEGRQVQLRYLWGRGAGATEWSFLDLTS